MATTRANCAYKLTFTLAIRPISNIAAVALRRFSRSNYYQRMGNSGDFDLAMQNACKLKSANCPKVADYYYSIGHSALENERNTTNA